MLIPREDRVPDSINEVISNQPYWLARDIPLEEWININFIEAFIKRGTCVMGEVKQFDIFGMLMTF